MPKWLKITLIAFIAAIAIASMVATCGMAASGAVSGAIGGSAFGKTAYLISNTAVSGLSSVGSDWMNGTLGAGTIRSSLTNASFSLVFSANHEGAQKKRKCKYCKNERFENKNKIQ